MPSIRQHNAWKRLAEMGKKYRYKRPSRSIHEKVDDQQKCMWGLLIIVTILSILEAMKLWN
jgi:hypothetical protein